MVSDGFPSVNAEYTRVQCSNAFVKSLVDAVLALTDNIKVSTSISSGKIWYGTLNNIQINQLKAGNDVTLSVYQR